jgi:hypothetical protein
LDVPLVLLLSAPVLPTGMKNLQAPRSQDLVLSWTRGVADVRLLIQSPSSERTDGMPGNAFLSCSFASEAGTGTVKAALLQQLQVGNQLNLFTARIKLIDAGPYAVTLGYATSVANPEKNAFPYVELQ